MNTGILKYPGGHGNDELLQCLPILLQQEVKEIWYTDPIPAEIDLLIIGGGFPCHKNGSIEQTRKESFALDQIFEFANAGKYVIGINHGFQLLCELNLLPGKVNRNPTDKFICRYVFLKPESKNSTITSALHAEEIFLIPISTYSGRYYADEEELIQMRQKDQILFRYSDHLGRITESVNYVGSKDNIAAVCNAEKNVFGIIPQPERGVSSYANISDGWKLFEGLIQGIFA